MQPKRIDHYNIEKEINSGGMGLVYQAYDSRVNRPVALKFLTNNLNDATIHTRFHREVQTVASLEHEAIVPIYDYGNYKDQPYFVMRLMKGGSLKDRLAKGALPLNHTVDILLRISEALDLAHQTGVIHRDLKPDNILFDEYGLAYLTDFGIAKVIESSIDLTKTNTIMGTWPYISPETFNGSRQVDLRADIYALGIITFQMMTGELPFKANSPTEWLGQHLIAQLPLIEDFNPDIPSQAQPVLEKAVAKEASERFESAGAFAQAFARSVTPTLPMEAIPKPPPVVNSPPIVEEERPYIPNTTPTRETQRFGNLWLYLGIGVGLFLLMGAVFFFISRPSEEQIEQPLNLPTPSQLSEDANTPTPMPAEVVPTKNSADPTHNLVVLTFSDSAIWQSKEMINRIPISGTISLTQNDWPVQLESNASVMALALPDQSRLFLNETTAVSIQSIATIGEIEETAVTLQTGDLLHTSNGSPLNLTASGVDSIRLTNGSVGLRHVEGEIWVDCLEGQCEVVIDEEQYALSTGNQLRVGETIREEQANYAYYAPFTETNISLAPTSTPTHTPLPTATATAVPTQPPILPTPANTAPTGTIVTTCFIEGFDELCTIDPNTGAYIQLSTVQSTSFYGSISPFDGNILFSSRRDGSFLMYTMDQSGNNILQIGPTHLGSIFAPEHSPDGRKISFTVAANDTQNIWVMDSDGSNLIQLSNFEGESVDSTWSPDSQQIAFATTKDPQNVELGMTHYIINVDGTGLREVEADVELKGGRSDWSPDGQWLAFYAGPRDDRDIFITRVDSPEVYQLTDGGRNLAPSFSPNGDWIAYTSYQDGDGEIFIMRLDGTEKRQLTFNSYTDWQPRWGIQR